MNTHSSTFRQLYRHCLSLVIIPLLCGMAGIGVAEESPAGIFPDVNPVPGTTGTVPIGQGGPKVSSTDCDVEINFDELSAPQLFGETTRLTETYAYSGIHFEGPGDNDGGAVIQDSTWGISGHSSPNFLAFNAGSTLSDGGTPTGPETVLFDEPIVFFEAAFGSSSGGDITLRAYNAADSPIHMITQTVGPAVQRMRVMGSGIKKVIVSCTANAWIMDDICIIREGDAGVLLLTKPCENSQDFASPALANLGYTDVTKITDADEFEFAIRTGAWRLVIVENYSAVLSEAIYDALYDYHNAAGRIIFASYDLYNHDTEGFVTIGLGITVESTYTEPIPIYAWGPTPLFSTPNTLPDLTTFINPCAKDGARVNTTTGTMVAGYTASEQAGEAAIVLNGTERIILNAFIPGIVDQDANNNGKNDMVELYENEIHLLAGTGETALHVSPASLTFALPPDGAETQQVVLENTLEVPMEMGWTSGTARVLFVCTDFPGPFWDELLLMAGIGTVDYIDARYETPDLPALLQYDVVLVASNYSFLDSETLGNALADYVDEGGKVIHAAATSLNGYGIAGRFQSGGYMAFNPTNTSDFQEHTLGDHQVGHPIMEGITALENFFTWDLSLTYGAELVAEWHNGLPLLATKGDSIVGINLFVAGLNPRYGGDVAQLFRNAILWLRGPSLISFDPSNGHLFPGDTVTVEITADAASLPLNYLETFTLGFKGYGGGHATVETSLVVCSLCMGNAAFAQRPTMPAENSWGAYTSNTDSGYKCYESYFGVANPITGLRWWGVDVTWDPSFSECDRPDPDPFLITFYADEAGMPGTLVHTEEVSALPLNTGLVGSDFYEIKEYEAALSETVSLAAGWISIEGTGDSSCWFLWAYSPEGNGSALQAVGSGDPGLTMHDLSLCIATEMTPHPADLNADFQLVLSEAIAYLTGWQQGTNPIGYAIRAAYLWQNGEHYVYDGGEEAPLCWVLAP